jgi:4-carboxymuconolactone decarboxylase
MKRLIPNWLAVGLFAAAGAIAGQVLAQDQPAKLAAQSTPQTRAQSLFGDINPKLAELTDNVLFGDVWKRPELSPRDRSLVTVSALVTMNRPEQLRSHLRRARDNGLTETQLIEAITHLAFYTGWPNGVEASMIAKEVFEEKRAEGQKK